MKESEPITQELNIFEKQDEIALRATEMQKFKEVIEGASDKLAAIRAVRSELQEYFPEIKDLPDPYPRKTTATNEFYIAKKIVELLWEN